MLRTLFIFLLVSLQLNSNSQFVFSGEVSEEYKNSKAYLVLVDDYNKNGLLLVKNIVAESKIDSNNNFIFSGSFLPVNNQYFNIYIDKCNNNINDSKHLLNRCDSQISKLFIANNKDTIYFPLNGIDQMLCDIKVANTQAKHNLHRIDSMQEELLSEHGLTINEAQRNIIYENYFNKLKEFSSDQNEPLIELYAYSLYSSENSFSRNYYLSDIKNSTYYSELLSKMETQYNGSPYTEQLKKDLIKDNYFKENSETSLYKTLCFILGFLFIFALVIILLIYKKAKTKTAPIDYKKVLTAQELKVFELMKQQFSNKEIAENLFVSLSTIKSHINNIYTKLSIKSRKEIENFSS